MKKARLIVTYKCEKNCEGCCNKDWKGLEPKKISNLKELESYDEIIITGGEPMLFPEKLLDLVEYIRTKVYKSDHRGKIILYTAKIDSFYILPILNWLQGLTYTIHEQEDTKLLPKISSLIVGYHNCKKRLHLFNGISVNGIHLTPFEIVKTMTWIKDCPLPEDETLFILENLW